MSGYVVITIETVYMHIIKYGNIYTYNILHHRQQIHAPSDI